MSSEHQDYQRPDSALLQPQQIRVMLPVEDQDHKVPVIQKTIQIPVVHEPSGEQEVAFVVRPKCESRSRKNA